MYGRNLLPASTVSPTRVSADGNPFYKPAGVTIDWTTVAAPVGDQTLADGSVVKSGSKFLRYGQILTKIAVAASDVVTINGGPSGGTFTVSVTAGGSTQTTGNVAYNATAGTLQTAIQGLSNVGAGNATVTGSAGGPYTITFANALGPVTVTSNGALLTGGTTPTATTAAVTPGGDVGQFGPYDPAAVDGRATLARGDAFILDETLLQYGIAGSGVQGSNDQVGGVFDGGLVWIDRVLHSGVVTHTLALGPTLAEFLSTFPAVRLARN